jgi:uncharacterized protein
VVLRILLGRTDSRRCFTTLVLMTDSTVSPSPATRRRLAEFDVVRALTLIGVFTMNYIVEWNIVPLRRVAWPSLPERRWLLTVMNPWKGPLSTRFAATMAMLAGMGIALGAASVIARGDRAAITEQRWRLRRRGLLFVFIGVMFDAVWPGEILHYMGTYFVIAAWAITWSRLRLVMAAVVVMVVTAIERIAVFQYVGVVNPSWWGGSEDGGYGRAPVGTPRGYLSSVLSWGAHPILPWMSFVFIGMLLAKVLVLDAGFDGPSARIRLRLIAVGFGLLIAGYAIQTVGDHVLSARWKWIGSVQPGGFSGIAPFGLAMPAYVLAASGSSITAIVALSWLARRWARWLPVRMLAHAGQMTFTLYVLHGLIPWILIDYKFVGQNFGLVRSLLIAVVSWFVAVVAAAGYHRWRRIGPMEWLLRRIGG